MRLLLSLLVACVLLGLPHAVSADPVILEVGPTTWDCPYTPVQMLQVALASMGCEKSYDELMVLSGAGFRMCWRDRNFNFPAITLYQQDPISVGAIAVGAQVERRRLQTAEAAFEAIADSIDAGCPLIAWDDGRADMQIICGYDDADSTIYRKNIDTGAGEPEHVPVATTRALPFVGVPCELWIVRWEPPEEETQQDWPLVLANAVRLAQWLPEDRVYEHFLCGETACQAWATDLLDESLYEEFPQAGYMAARLAWHMQHARGICARFLQSNVLIHPKVLEAALLLQDEATLFGDAQRVLCGGLEYSNAEAASTANVNVADAEVRAQAAGLIEQAMQKHHEACAAMAAALQDLGEPTQPLVDFGPDAN